MLSAWTWTTVVSSGVASNVYNMSNGGATKYANRVAGVSRDENVAEMWKNHFAGLYNSVNECGFKIKYLIVLKTAIVTST